MTEQELMKAILLMQKVAAERDAIEIEMDDADIGTSISYEEELI